MKEINNLTIKYHDRIVGILAETKDGKGAFQYDKEWLLNGFSIGPFSLPLSGYTVSNGWFFRRCQTESVGIN